MQSCTAVSIGWSDDDSDGVALAAHSERRGTRKSDYLHKVTAAKLNFMLQLHSISLPAFTEGLDDLSHWKRTISEFPLHH